MQQIEQHVEPQIKRTKATNGAALAQNRKRVETVVETLATLGSRGESLAEVAHDARNMVTALGLYCDLLEEPGVLATPFAHYGNELRLVASASRRLVEKLVAIDAHSAAEPTTPPWFNLETGRWPFAGEARAAQPRATEPRPAGIVASTERVTEHVPGPNPNGQLDRNRRWDLLPAVPVTNLAAELLANRNLLSALAGPTIAVTVDAESGAQPVRLTGEDLTRILVNLVKNAAEAMPASGRIHIRLSERRAVKGAAPCVTLAIEDNGPGIPAEALEKIFMSGDTAHGKERGDSGQSNGGWPLSHRGLGLAITRSIVEAAGGRIFAANRERGVFRDRITGTESAPLAFSCNFEFLENA